MGNVNIKQMLNYHLQYLVHIDTNNCEFCLLWRKIVVNDLWEIRL